MRAACYCRKSTDSEAGVARQIELCKDFIADHGWTLDAAHIFSDNDVSGAVFKRPGLDALLLAMAATPRPFDVLVMMDASRLGRDMEETLPLQGRITRAGVRIFHYQDGQELLLSTPVQKLVASVANFSHEDFRYQIRLKTAAALRKKAEQGHVAGAKVYGYRNVKQGVGPDGTYSHVLREIDAAQAAVVERMFQMVASGYGCRRIARTLNSEGVPFPQAGHICTPKCKHRPYTGWATTSVRALLSNELYRGRVAYGTMTPQDAPHLRIVSEALWNRAHARLAKTALTYTGRRRPNGQLEGRPEAGLIARHLLSGLLQCGGCSGKMTPVSRTSSRKGKDSGPVRSYWGCSAFYKQGQKCSNTALVPYDKLTEAIVGRFTNLHEDVIEELVSREWDQWIAEQAAREGSLDATRAEVERLDGELANLAQAVAQGGEIPALVKALAAKQAVRDEAAARLEHAQGLAQTTDPGWHVRLFNTTALALGTLKETLEARGPAGREILCSILPKPIVIRPAYEDGRLVGWDYEGEAMLGGMLEALEGRVSGGKSGSVSSRVPNSQSLWVGRG